MKAWMAAAGLLLSGSAMAQQNPIDHTLEQCLNDATTTAAMVACYSDASRGWDGEMNRQYSQLIKRLSGEPEKKLRSAQRQWLIWRDSWQAAAAAYFAHTQGSLAQVSLAAQTLSLMRNQALMLQSMNKGSCASDTEC
ncbi:DUF1311 domain-containing protein [Candidatus Pantoea deserta]|uniref:DUF1311 domain-containing protein n=1 Tax=Candidatus Pantoea deserta TaxID=1869313 RepID=A0A3N4NIR6_9GAMM|nr:lysozyme inhibitor LprI family protein [Pantoea deserta]RPD96234.1 DUF1311 domain-containing protein [Pantoea deserta]